MVVDVEITLNRFYFKRCSYNKIQFGFIRLAWWTTNLGKHALSFEINWKLKKKPSIVNEKEFH